MTLPLWPAELGRPDQEGYSRARLDNRRHSQSQQGPRRVQGGRSKFGEIVSFSLFATIDRQARFWRFFDEEVAAGALPFVMENPEMTGQPLTTETGDEIIDENGEVITIVDTWLCLFGQNMTTVTSWGMHYRLAFDLVIMP